MTTLRSAEDCRRILAKATPGARVAVIGGSFIALEAAASLRGRGLSVDLVAPEAHPLEKIFGRQLSDLVVQAHADKGVRLHLGSKVASVEGDRVRLEGGQEIAADLVIVGIGVEPRIALAEAAGLKLDRGVAVNSRLETSHSDIFAAGDIARWPDPHTGDTIRVDIGRSPSARARLRPRTCWAAAETRGNVRRDQIGLRDPRGGTSGGPQ